MYINCACSDWTACERSPCVHQLFQTTTQFKQTVEIIHGLKTMKSPIMIMNDCEIFFEFEKVHWKTTAKATPLCVIYIYVGNCNLVISCMYINVHPHL